jgi:hypothetical protein
MWNSVGERPSVLEKNRQQQEKGQRTAFSNVSNVVVLEVENALGVLNDGGGVGSDEELDGLGHAVVGEESARLGANELSTGGVRGGRNGEETASGLRGGLAIKSIVGVSGTGKLDVNEVNLELLLRLDTDEDGGTTTSDNDLVRVVDRLEDEGEGSLELHDDRLDESGEADLLALLRVVEVLGEDGGDLSVGVGLEDVAALLEDETQLLVCREGEKGEQAVVEKRRGGNAQLVMIPLWTTVNSLVASLL